MTVPEGMTFEDAAQALSDASATPEPGQAPVEATPAATSPPAPPEVGTATNQPADAGAEESFTQLDPNSLTEVERARYDSMQADYTRKMQSIAPYREFAEQGIDPARAAQAVQFIDALESDPQFVQQVHARLSEALQQQGLSPAQANAAAAAEITAAAGEGEAGGEWSDPESELQKQVEELKSWKESFEEERASYAMAAEIQRSEMAIRQANPNYNDEDMARVFELAFAHGGDLMAAEQSYRAIRDYTLSAYLDSKGSAAASAPPLVEGASHASVPAEGFGDDIEAAHKAALSHLLNTVADQ
jgi:hypothetical protein